MELLTATLPLVMFFSSGGDLAVLLLGPASCVGFYALIYFYYRNTNKRYDFERETSVKVKQMMSNDRKIGTNNGTRDSGIRGDNTKDSRRRIKRH